MDPNATLEILENNRSLAEADSAARIGAVRDLARWLNRGGFEPEWKKYPSGTAYFAAVASRLFQIEPGV